MLQIVSLLLLLLAVSSCSKTETPAVVPQKKVTIDNTEPRRDEAGNIIDAHGGCLQIFDGRFYLYGTSYGSRKDSLDVSNYFSVYSSPDLEHWKNEGRLLKEQPTGVYTRPSVIFNPNTHKYVLWYNWFPTLWNGQTGVAMSDTPVGPFVITNLSAHLSVACPGDGSLFADDDGKAYYIYTAMKEGYGVLVERLNADYSDSTGDKSPVMATSCEAPVLFRRGNVYYALAGSLCPDCAGGAEVQVLKSVSPLGPFRTKPQANINRRVDVPVSYMLADGAIHRAVTNAAEIIVPAQQTWVAKIPLSDTVAYIWMGDRWQSTPDGSKGHDFQYWSTPLEFNAEGDIAPMNYVKRWFLMQ